MQQHFVDREEQISFIIQQVVEPLLQGGELRHRIFEYYGVAGVGKTSLLKVIEGICTQHEITCFYQEFAEGASTETAEVSLLNKIVTQVIAEDTDEVRAFRITLQEYKNRVEQPGIAQSELRFWGKRVASDFLRCLRDHRFFLLLDSFDRISAGAIAYLEQEIFAQVVTNNPAVIILAGRKRIGWTSYAVKRLLSLQKLSAFSKQDSAKQLEDLGVSECPDEIYQITNGHPAANIVVKDLLGEIERARNRKVNCEDFGDYECRLIQAVKDEVILRPVPAELNPILPLLSIPRKLNESILAAVLATDMPALSWNLDEASKLIGKLNSAGLVQSDGRGGYVLDLTTRLILSLEMRFSNPDKYLRITQEIVEHFLREIQNRGEPEAIVEALYHLADRFRLEEKRSDVEIASGQIHKLQEWLTPLLSRMEQEKRGTLTNLKTLYDMISNDQELLARIGYKQEIDVLRETVESFIDRALITRRISLTIEKHQFIDRYGLKFEIEGEAVPLSTEEKPVNSARKQEILKSVRDARSEDDLIKIGRMVCTQFLTVRFQNFLMNVQDPLTIFVNESEIPWELIHDGNEFVFLRVPVGRRTLTAEESKKNRAKRGDRLRFLVVGVSKVNAPGIGASFKPIDGVIREVKAIATHLESDANLVDFERKRDLLIDEDATAGAFLERLSSGEYNVIHFAGHTYENEEGSSRALALYDELLSEENLADSVGGRPLVFLNGCKTAAAKSDDVKRGYVGKTTMGLAHHLTIGGALACVGNLWTTPDFSSVDFPIMFYRNILRRRAADRNILEERPTVGEAMRQARTAIRDRGDLPALAWASYVLYGDPTVSLF